MRPSNRPDPRDNVVPLYPGNGQRAHRPVDRAGSPGVSGVAVALGCLLGLALTVLGWLVLAVWLVRLVAG